MNNSKIDNHWISLKEYNNSVTLTSSILTGKEFRRLKRKTFRK